MTSQLLTVAAAAPRVHIAAPEQNAREMLTLAVENADASVILFPELAITGYTCADLFGQAHLLRDAGRWLTWLAKEAWGKGCKGLLAVGAPVAADGRLFNCLVLLHGGAPVAVVPKSCLPNYGEFYEKRWFAPAAARRFDHLLWPLENGECLSVPFGEDILVADRTGARDCIPAILDADPLKETVDVDVYEDIDIAGHLPAPGDARTLHYVNFGADGDWIFTVERVEERPQWLPPEYYPAVIGELSEGPDPLQYDPDLYRYNIAPDAAGDDGADGEGEAGAPADGDAVGVSGEDADDDWSLEAFLRDND